MNPPETAAAPAEMIGRVFGDRYRLDGLIGVGALTAVYEATDLVASDRVAVKLFDAQIAADESLVGELIEAAERAAVVRHTNIAEIYDWGIDHGPYIVSELCEGASLADMRRLGGTLSPSQALVVTLEIARALNSGHEQGLVHAGLRPANVLFTENHQVRVSDFGVAAAISDVVRERHGDDPNMIRYVSPEQARGRPISEATDVYAVALVANEAVSGAKPAVADTVVGTLMQRAESPAALDKSLDTLLGPLERCGRLEPEQRPEAEELAISLLATAESMSRPEPLPLAGIRTPLTTDTTIALIGGSVALGEPATESTPVTSLAGADDHDPGGLAADYGLDFEGFDDDSFDLDELNLDPAVPQPALAVVPEPGGLNALDSLDEAEPVFAEVPTVADEPQLDVPIAASAGRAAPQVYEEIHDDADDELPWWPLVAVSLIVLAVAATFGFLTFGGSDVSAVPNLVGVNAEDLADRIDGTDWQVVRLEDRVAGFEAGTIVRHTPAAGEDLDHGQELIITVSLGNEMVEIPNDIVGLTVDQATSRLVESGLALGSLAQENSEEFPEGLVVGLNEPTTQKPAGEGVSLLISLGPEDRVVPNEIIGTTIGDATSLLVGLRLQAVEEPAYSPDVEVGIVLSSIPLPGEIVPADSAVTLVVSAGPEPVEMPDIVGFTLEEAIDEIESLGLIWLDTTGTPGEDVIGSLPPIGAMAEVGTEVTIILADPVDEDEDTEDTADE